jgi:hypothetical protein
VLLRRREHPARSWPDRRTPALDQLHRFRQPRPTRDHGVIVAKSVGVGRMDKPTPPDAVLVLAQGPDGSISAERWSG